MMKTMLTLIFAWGLFLILGEDYHSQGNFIIGAAISCWMMGYLLLNASD